jgi:hypothetical protein
MHALSIDVTGKKCDGTDAEVDYEWTWSSRDSQSELQVARVVVRALMHVGKRTRLTGKGL